MTRRLDSNTPAFPVALEAADHQCQHETVRGRGADRRPERCVHTDRANYTLCLVIDNGGNVLVMCEPCLEKIQTKERTASARKVLPGQESLF